MTSIFERALGNEFHRLHPMMQRRFGVGLDSHEACIGRGTMQEIRRGPWWTVPFLQLGRERNILVPVVGNDVKFAIANYLYRDPFGREAVTFVREYVTEPTVSRFDATMVFQEGRLIDYLGTHQHLATDLDLRVDVDGGLELRSGSQRFLEGPINFSFPMAASGRALLRERWNEAARQFEVQLEIRNDRFGFLFGYRGSFQCEWVSAIDAPPHLKPVRHERRM